jgi:cytochrome P450
MTTQAQVGAALPTQGRVATGPQGCFLFGSVSEFRKDAIGFLTRAVRDHGDFVKLDLVRTVYLLNHPNYVQHVLHDRHVNYRKSFVYDRMRPLVGNGLLTSEGDFWKRQRRLAQPAFHRQRLTGFADLMVARTGEMLERWAPRAAAQEVVNVHSEMMALTLGIVGDALFGVDVTGKSKEVGQALTTTLEITNDRFQQLFLLPKAVPTPQNVRFNGALAVLDRLVNDVIAERRGSTQGKDDLLGMFMEIKDAETGESMNDAQLRDEVMTMVLAGHETTANALAWTFYLLSKAPAVARKLQTEVAAVLEGRTPGIADLPKLELTTAIINEAMRLYPPAWLIGREAIEDDVIDRYPIKAGQAVVLCAYTTHRHPKFWDNPQGFDPDRFLAPASAQRPKLAYFPFAAGPRMCIGNAFAMMEMQLVLASIAQRYQLDLVPGFEAEMDPNVTLRPAEGIPTTLRAVA